MTVRSCSNIQSAPALLPLSILKMMCPEELKIKRLEEIIALQNKISKEQNKKCVGKIYEVLVEGVSKRSTDQMFWTYFPKQSRRF